VIRRNIVSPDFFKVIILKGLRKVARIYLFSFFSVSNCYAVPDSLYSPMRLIILAIRTAYQKAMATTPVLVCKFT
jgi:hypothetical protein